MSWYWILYGVGYVVAFAIIVSMRFSEVAHCKRKLLQAQKGGSSEIIKIAQTAYDDELGRLFWIPISVSFVWPIVLGGFFVAVTVTCFGWLLDKAVVAFMREDPDQ